jgi:hypothetical protein
VSFSKAKELLELAEKEGDRLRRHLLVAAAMREVISHDPIVVGGTAEEYWSAAEYHQTDLDMCAPIGRRDEESLKRLNFYRIGRHWERRGLAAVVEFPESKIDGDEARTVEEEVGPGRARIIGLDDLYLDRLRQATIDEHREGVEFKSALAVVAARYEDIDWGYVNGRVREIARRDAVIGGIIKRLDSRIRRRVRERLRTSDE